MRRIFFIAIACGLALASAAVVVEYFFLRPSALRVAVARDTDDHKLIAAVAHVLSATRENIRLRIHPREYGGGKRGGPPGRRGGSGRRAIGHRCPPNGQTLVILHHNPAFLIARDDSPIGDATELKGKRIGIVRGTASGAGNSTLLDLILAQSTCPRTRSIMFCSIEPMSRTP